MRHRTKRKLRKFIKVLGTTLIVVVLLAIMGGSGYMLHFSLGDSSGRDSLLAEQRLGAEYPHIKVWADSLRRSHVIRDTFMTTQDGRRLHALFAPAEKPTRRTAFVIHGYTCSAVYYLYIGYLFRETLGYNIFVPDLHAHGQSEGKMIQMGWKDADDMLEWLPLCNELFRDSLDAEIIVHGTSMGGATAMNLSGKEDMEYVKAYIEDSGYTSVWDEFSYELKEQFGMPEIPLMYTSSGLCKLLNGWSFGEANSVDMVRHCQKPMLFIHSDNDTFVPSWMVHPLYEAKHDPKTLWIVPKSAHHEAYRDYPEEYADRVKAFIEENLGE